KEFIKYQNRHNAILQEIKKLSGIKEEIENKIKTNNLELKNIPPISNINEKEYKKLQKELKDAHTKLGAISQQLIELNEKLLNKKKLEEKIALKKDKFKIIEALNIAIGSADGKKFKKIALNYLMENLLNIANIHLQKITQNRYLFKKSQDLNRLTLYIIDRFYENQEREVTTLSGGEKFLASLALAFGLSDMTSNKSKIDTLFLDEGFGTLDNNSLNLALNILKEASNNKSVGIISHIDALKEEIPYQIRVIKKPNGRSYIKLFS
ncbi:MAG: lantibiotic ABC transporter, partial [Epsilonproteobacteria bacterium]|nr:lantibiotic ABC transporter [Campylobacterota bacterium]